MDIDAYEKTVEIDTTEDLISKMTNPDIIPNWKKSLILKLKEKIDNNPKIKLTFIHTPKCAGSYAGNYLSLLNIRNKRHKRARVKGDGITFTIIRDPVDRFESLLNYRLGRKKLGKDWPNRLRGIQKNKNLSLDDIISKFGDGEITGFKPYHTLNYWAKNVKILLTVEEFLPFLALMGYKINKIFPKIHVSKKTRGKLSEHNRNRLKKLFEKDIKLYQFWSNKLNLMNNQNIDNNTDIDNIDNNNNNNIELEKSSDNIEEHQKIII